MAASYPTSIKTWTPVADNTDSILAAHINGAYDEIIAVETALNYSTPIGEIKIWPAATAPTKYLLCDGAAISRSTYSVLFTLIGTTYGVGDTTTTFNIPNLKGRVPVGLDAAQTEFDVLAETGGHKLLQTHNHKLLYETGALGSTGATVGAGAIDFGTVTGSTGGGNGENMPPYITINYIIRVLV